jgi:hypothetical protein
VILMPIEHPDLDSDIVMLADIPKVNLSPAPKAGADEARIEALVATLASLENLDLGVSPTIGDRAFLPLNAWKKAGAFVLTNPRIRSSDALKRLVALGPAALPALLAHLDDPTPTKLRVDHDGRFGAMWFANELSGNPLSRPEQAVLQIHEHDEKNLFGREHVRSYVVKVGDICLVAIGQITGRGYQTVRYQPTACVVINSPTHDAELCAQVRAMWQSDDPRRRLFDSLLLDYRTQGKYDGVSFDGWYVGSNLQVEATMRLLYYFPKESASLIAARIDRLNVSRIGPPTGEPKSDSEFDAWVKREVENGVRTDKFIAAAAWSNQPEIIASIKRMIDRTDDKELAEIAQNTRKPLF